MIMMGATFRFTKRAAAAFVHSEVGGETAETLHGNGRRELVQGRRTKHASSFDPITMAPAATPRVSRPGKASARARNHHTQQQSGRGTRLWTSRSSPCLARAESLQASYVSIRGHDLMLRAPASFLVHGLVCTRSLRLGSLRCSGKWLQLHQ